VTGIRRPFLIGLALLALGTSSGCLKARFKFTVYPDGSGKLDYHLELRKDMDPFRQLIEGIEGILRKYHADAKMWRAVNEQLKKAINKSFVKAFGERTRGIVAWSKPKLKRKKNSTVYDLVGYFEDINKVQLKSDEDSSHKSAYTFSKLEDGSFELTFNDENPKEGLKDGPDDPRESWDSWLKKMLTGLEYVQTYRMPGRIREAEGMRITGREAEFKLKREDVRACLEDPEGFEEGIGGRIVSDPDVNVIGEMRAFQKELDKVRKEWEKLVKEVEDYELPEDDE
jgi:hypothetical protein